MSLNTYYITFKLGSLLLNIVIKLSIKVWLKYEGLKISIFGVKSSVSFACDTRYNLLITYYILVSKAYAS
jgi:hypothetical protein